MSKIRALAALAGEFTDRIPQWDFPDNVALAESLCDFDLWEDTEKTSLELFKHFDIDMTHYIPGGTAEWNFPLVRYYGDADLLDVPHREDYRRAYPYLADKPYRSMYDKLNMGCRASFWGLAPTLVMKRYACASPEEVLAFDPLEYDSYTLKDREAFFQSYYPEKQQKLGDDALMMGWYYHTLFMWPVEIFGWENFMMAAMLDPVRFDALLDRFFQLTLRDLRAMCSVEDLPLIACHDDLCSAAGPMFHPDWYRRYVYPRYRQVFDLIHTHGKKALFVCDGDVMQILPELSALEMDGLAVDGHSDLRMVREAMSGRIITGGMRSSIVSGGTLEEIEQMVRQTASLMMDEPGYFFQSSGMAGTAPPDKVEFYQECVRKYGKRQ